MMKKIKFSYFLFLSGLLFIGWGQSSCNMDELPDPNAVLDCDSLVVSYNNQIKPIIDNACAIPGCHVQGGGAPGNFENYTSMTPYLSDSEFKKYVIDLRDDPEKGMPPNWDTNPGPFDLTEAEFNLVSCWVLDGYPEN